MSASSAVVVASGPKEDDEDGRLWDAYNRLLLGPDTERLRKLLVRSDLLRRALTVPGDVVECGVFKGAGLLYWLKLLSIFAPGTARRVVGFDMFTSFGPTRDDAEAAAVAQYVEESAFEGITVASLQQRVREAGFDADACDLVEGDVAVSATAYVRDRPGFRIALLHLDLDLGDATYAALEALWPRVVSGGVVVFDEYAVPRWTESDGVDRFVNARGLRLRPVPRARTPTAMLIKE